MLISQYIRPGMTFNIPHFFFSKLSLLQIYKGSLKIQSFLNSRVPQLVGSCKINRVTHIRTQEHSRFQQNKTNIQRYALNHIVIVLLSETHSAAFGSSQECPCHSQDTRRVSWVQASSTLQVLLSLILMPRSWHLQNSGVSVAACLLLTKSPPWAIFRYSDHVK